MNATARIALVVLCLNADKGTAQTLSPEAAIAQRSSPTLPAATVIKEDWTSPALANGVLKLEEAVTGERDNYPGFTREMIRVTWRDDDPIYVFLIMPKHRPKPPVIIYLYSYPSDTDRFLNDDFCEFLAKDGFAAVGFVSALTGQRYHDRPMKEWFVSELQESLASSAHDVQMLLNYLAGRGDLDMNRAGMFGEGSGAAIGVLAAAADPRIKALDLVDTWGDWPDWLANSNLVPEDERKDYIKPEFLKCVAPLDPIDWFGRVKVPVRLQYLSEPLVTPSLARERIVAAAPKNARVVAYADAVAQYKAEKLKFFDWIKDQLRQMPEQ